MSGNQVESGFSFQLCRDVYQSDYEEDEGSDGGGYVDHDTVAGEGLGGAHGGLPPSPCHPPRASHASGYVKHATYNIGIWQYQYKMSVVIYIHPSVVRLAMESVMSISGIHPGNRHHPLMPAPPSLSPWWCKYCSTSGRGDGDLRRHFEIVHFTSCGLGVNILR